MASDLQIDCSVIATVCRRSPALDGLATAWVDPTRVGEGRCIALAGTGTTTLLNYLERHEKLVACGHGSRRHSPRSRRHRSQIDPDRLNDSAELA
jgi:hypothetical protein